MNSLKWLLLVMIGFGPVSSIFAQDEFEQVKVLEHPRYSLTNRFVFDADFSFLPLDAYYKPITLQAAVSYQPSDLFSWEIGRFGYSLHNYDTGLESFVNRQLGPTSQAVAQKDLHLKRLRFMASSTAFLNLLYSKSNFFNQSITYYYWQLGMGGSWYDMKEESQAGLDLVLRVRFFMSDNVSVTFRGGHTIGFLSDAPNNISFIGLGAAFAL